MTETARLTNTSVGMVDFAATYRGQVAYVWKSLARLGVRVEEREDLAHDVFIAALRNWARFDALRPVEPWLFGIAYRTVLGFRRRQRVQFEDAAVLAGITDARHGPDEALAHAQGLKIAAGVLETLELDRRAVFVLHDIDGYGMPEIADALEVPLNTAYSRLRLARRDFNEAAEALRRKDSHG